MMKTILSWIRGIVLFPWYWLRGTAIDEFERSSVEGTKADVEYWSNLYDKCQKVIAKFGGEEY